MAIYRFPDKFFWGVTTAAHHIEENLNNDWSTWEKANAERLANLSYQQFGKLPFWKAIAEEAGQASTYIAGTGRRSFENYERDLKLIKSLNLNSYRFSLEWARIEPEPGKFSHEAIAKYRQMLVEMKAMGIEPFLTLWHFSSPTWFAERGGWENPDNVMYFLRYVQFVLDNCSDLVNYWIILNEPDIYCRQVYLIGEWLVQKRSLRSYRRAFANFVAAHRQAYDLIKTSFPDAQVGSANHVSSIEVALPSFLGKIATWVAEELANMRFIRATIGKSDWLGINHYHHVRVHLRRVDMAPYGKSNDLGWGIYPPAMRRQLLKMKQFGKPIIVTENGTADYADSIRPAFIRDYLLEIHRAIEQGADVRGYLHFSLMDNFEWSNGYVPKFGLARYDTVHNMLVPQPSAALYSRYAGTNSVNTEIPLPKLPVTP